MAFVTGLVLIDAPASALNNSTASDNTGRVKQIRGLDGVYPYASAQSFRFWLRDTMGKYYPDLPSSAVTIVGKDTSQQAYTDADPITYWDDDLMGYMRAPKGGKKSAEDAGSENESLSADTSTSQRKKKKSIGDDVTVTRISPFRTSTLISIAPVQITKDFGVMARPATNVTTDVENIREGAVLHGHEHYRTVFLGLWSLDLSRAGVFTNERRTGYKNLRPDTEQKAREANLEEIEGGFRLPLETRFKRVKALLSSLARLEGGAKQTLHYTDVNPKFVLAAVTKGGNHIFGYAVKSDENSGLPVVNQDALNQVLDVYKPDVDLLSKIYAGRVEGFMDASKITLQDLNITTQHPRQTFDALINDVESHPEWFD